MLSFLFGFGMSMMIASSHVCGMLVFRASVYSCVRWTRSQVLKLLGLVEYVCFV